MKVMALSMVALIGTIVSIVCAEDPEDYVPHLTSVPLGGNITASTFVLEQPRCVFNGVVNDTDQIWLVVSLGKAIPNFTLLNDSENWPYQSFPNNSLYMTLNTSTSNYPCPSSSEPNKTLTVLRVGTDTSCVNDTFRPECNGPLPGPGPYRVMFLAMDSGGVKAATQWSEPITLRQAKSLDTIDVWPRRRSAGMIIITSILSVLSAILLAALVAVLIYKCSNSCDGANVTSARDPTITRYFSHHIYDQSVYKS